MPQEPLDIILIIMALNTVLSGIQKGLEVIKDKTESKVDDKTYDILTKVLSVTSTVISWLSANRK